VHGPFPENISTAAAIKVADIAVTDVDGGANLLSLAGGDAALFQIIGGDLWLRAGAHLDFETNPVLNVTVNVNDASVGGPVDASSSLAIAVTDIAENNVITGTNHADRLIGTNNGETINALAGNDGINGNGGNDRIIGGAGADRMTGGPGNDFFVFNSIGDSAPGQSGLVDKDTFSQAAGNGLRDVITDFTRGHDKIGLSAIDANNQVGGNQAFSWLGQGHFHNHVRGELIYRLFDAAGIANDKTIVYGDVNGDAHADFQIELTGLKPLTASDFIL
jgi:Ca2+-binding RTX toxin-like protein